MAKNEYTKRRVLLVYRMFTEGKSLTVPEIIRKLDLQYDIQSDRKTIYSDIREIDKIVPIGRWKHGNETFYQVIWKI